MGEVDSERQRMHEEWAALRALCRENHAKEMKGRAGGAAICVCGGNCGGTKACSMLARIKDMIRYLPAESLPEPWQQELANLRRVIH